MRISDHARERMAERNITPLDIHRTITGAQHRWKSKDNTLAFELGNFRVIVDPMVPMVVTAIRL